MKSKLRTFITLIITHSILGLTINYRCLYTGTKFYCKLCEVEKRGLLDSNSVTRWLYVYYWTLKALCLVLHELYEDTTVLSGIKTKLLFITSLLPFNNSFGRF